MANATPAGNTIPQDPKGAFTAARSRAGRHRSVNQNSPPAEPHNNIKGGPCVMHVLQEIVGHVAPVSSCSQGQNAGDFCVRLELCKDLHS